MRYSKLRSNALGVTFKRFHHPSFSSKDRSMIWFPRACRSIIQSTGEDCDENAEKKSKALKKSVHCQMMCCLVSCFIVFIHGMPGSGWITTSPVVARRQPRQILVTHYNCVQNIQNDVIQMSSYVTLICLCNTVYSININNAPFIHCKCYTWFKRLSALI